LWFGTNANSLTLTGVNGSLKQANCVNGAGNNDIFGQFASCNAKQFFAVVNAAVANDITLKPAIPPLGTAKDGKPCLTTRDFGLVDMDQSDNVVTSYLLYPNGATAQNTAANNAAKPNGTIIVNGSDNRLLAVGMANALGCRPYQVPDLANNGALTSALALDELHAAAQQQPPIALIPKGNPMARINNMPSLNKLNAYREAVNQRTADTLSEASTREYCVNFGTVGPSRILSSKNFTLPRPSPDPAAANNLFTFLSQRFTNSWTGLNCNGILDIPSPITLVQDANGVTTDATIKTIGFRFIMEQTL